MVKQKDLKDKVLEYFSQNRLMSLATANENMPWSATLFYAYTPLHEIIFYSRPDRVHSQHIAKNPYVSLAINHLWMKDKVIRGIQMTGKARMAEGEEKEKYYKIYEKRHPWAKKYASDHEVYVIEPLELHFLDEELFGHTNRVKVI